MREDDAVASFAALAQPLRLGMVRALVKAGAQGLSAGALAQDMGVAPSKLSFHLKILSEAGLVGFERHARSLIYRVHFAQMAGLVQFMLAECCEGSGAGLGISGALRHTEHGERR